MDRSGSWRRDSPRRSARQRPVKQSAMICEAAVFWRLWGAEVIAGLIKLRGKRSVDRRNLVKPKRAPI